MGTMGLKFQPVQIIFPVEILSEGITMKTPMLYIQPWGKKERRATASSWAGCTVNSGAKSSSQHSHHIQQLADHTNLGTHSKVKQEGE